MSKFEYLSVLVSIIVGLGISHLLSGAARLRGEGFHLFNAVLALVLFAAYVAVRFARLA